MERIKKAIILFIIALIIEGNVIYGCAYCQGGQALDKKSALLYRSSVLILSTPPVLFLIGFWLYYRWKKKSSSSEQF